MRSLVSGPFPRTTGTRSATPPIIVREGVGVTAAFLITVVAILLSPPAAPAEDTPPRPRYKAVATVGMIGDLVERIAGERAETTTLIGSGIDPHLYKPTRTDVATLLRADIIFYNGLLLEGKMADTLETVGRRKPVLAVAERIDSKWLLSGAIAPGAHHDPHVWMDVSVWSRAAEAVVDGLAEFDPARADEYRERGDALLAEMALLHQWAEESFETIPQGQRVMITAHDAFQYLGRAYGIEVHGVQGLSTESEAGLQDINRLVDMIIERKVPAIFVETSVSDKNVTALREGAAARGWNVAQGGSLFSDAMGISGTWEGTYIGMIDHNVTTIVSALGGEVHRGGFRAWKAARESASIDTGQSAEPTAATESER